MIERLSPEEFLSRLMARTYGDVFFVFEREELCYFPENNDFSMSIGLELATKTPLEVEVGEVIVAPTGVKWGANPELGLYLSVLPRSGLSRKTPLRIPNAPGTIEPTYRNDVGVLLECVPFKKEEGEFKGKIRWRDGKVFIEENTRVAQAVIQINFMVQMREESPVFPKNLFYTVSKDIYDEWHKIYPTKRGINGYGSTGV